MTEIIVALIGSAFTMATTLITALLQYRINTRNAAKESILQMILEDRVAVQEKHLPTNYQNILHEFDIYRAHGGNSYVERKVNEYCDWMNALDKGTLVAYNQVAGDRISK